jgi:hypothetical protein
MGLLGWKRLSDGLQEARGTLDSFSYNDDDGDISVNLSLKHDDDLLHNGDVENSMKYWSKIECEVKPTGGKDELQRWLAKIPINHDLLVGGIWVSDCSHAYDDAWNIGELPGDLHGVLDSTLPDPLKALGLPDLLGGSSRDWACDHGKTEIHPIHYIYAMIESYPWGGSIGDLGVVQRYVIIVLTDDPTTIAYRRPSLPPTSGTSVKVHIGLPFIYSFQTAKALTTGMYAPICKVAQTRKSDNTPDPHGVPDEVNHAASVSIKPRLWDNTSNAFAEGGKEYFKGAFADIDVETGPGGYYYGIVELSFAIPGVGVPMEPVKGFDPGHIVPPAFTLSPASGAPAGSWNGTWADRDTGAVRVKLSIAGAGSADPTKHNVDLLDTATSLYLSLKGLSATPTPVTPYTSPIWPETVRPAPGPAKVRPLIGGAAGAFTPAPGPARDIGHVSPILADTLRPDKNVSLFLYRALNAAKQFAGYHVRYLHTADDGTTKVDVMLVPYSVIK